MAVVHLGLGAAATTKAALARRFGDVAVLILSGAIQYVPSAFAQFSRNTTIVVQAHIAGHLAFSVFCLCIAMDWLPLLEATRALFEVLCVQSKRAIGECVARVDSRVLNVT